mgnify:CR=1 FL=1
MGGVVNLVSRRPGTKPEGQLLVNRSTRGATDAAFWQAAPLTDRWSYALLVSANGQSRFDADDDRWADLPRYARAPFSGRACSGTTRAAARSLPLVGTTIEDRIGGTLPGAVLAATWPAVISRRSTPWRF